MPRSREGWLTIIKGKTDYEIAKLILDDLIGYRRTSLKRADDADNLTALIAALRDQSTN